MSSAKKGESGEKGETVRGGKLIPWGGCQVYIATCTPVNVDSRARDNIML